MLTPMLMKKKAVIDPSLPYAGFNYDTNVSTGNYPVLSTHTAAMLVAPPIAVNGYSKVLNNKSSHAFSDSLARTYTDFTWVGRVLLGSTTNYVTMLNLLGQATGSQIRVADSGFGNRLQPDMNPNNIGTCWNCSLTRTDLAASWHHLAMVRKAGIVQFYVNGTLQSLANGVGSSYSATSYSDGTDMSGITGFITNTTAIAVYTAEWAFWDSAIYTANFTPPTGYLV